MLGCGNHEGGTVFIFFNSLLYHSALNDFSYTEKYLLTVRQLCFYVMGRDGIISTEFVFCS